ncbi:hypothetical protein Skr01_33680 [Sphaerisporangium krabiense]|uniref:Uncharacterized protein n=1 Tax=Sphaerisporangium krabiense TaxID=763782 RepID=A0A7W9DQG2_9ACTN|nr:hypothetical protein [Sphaerisporangium krabiense]MBB5626365.1 hypothetical protein [Sphaerisporangium krabiense]GII63283.1 hypothetical protein Skr01_33680 [Sphaerisporangium krabiense]
MPQRRDTSWHAEFLRLVGEGLSFRVAIRKLGKAEAGLHQHFEAYPEFRAEAMRLRGPRLRGALPDTSWHPHLPYLLAIGLSIPKAAAKLNKKPETVRIHLRRDAKLRAAVNAALCEAGRPELRLSPWG